MSSVSTPIPEGPHDLVEVNGRQNFKSLSAMFLASGLDRFSYVLCFTWCFNFSPACAFWRPWHLDGFSESAQRTTWPSNGCSEKCP